MTPTKILLSGASGMIGSAVLKRLCSQSIATLRLVRGESNPSYDTIHWNPNDPREDLPEIPTSFVPLDAAIHFSGANVAAHRWTAAYRKQLRQSRLAPTAALCKLFARMPKPPRVLISASAVGIYGDRGDEILTEDSPQGDGFLSDLCQEWEGATQPAEDLGMRVVHLRFGMVLGRDGGVLAKLLPVFKLGLGGKLGRGKQWMSWVALSDVVEAILFTLRREDLQGALNVVAPHPVTNAEFTQSLGRALDRPAGLAVPAVALKLAFGAMAEETMLASTRVLPARLSAAGFRFEYEEIEPALRSLVAS